MKQFLWILPFTSFILGYYTISSFHRVNELKTPSIVGQTLQTAFKTLSVNNLNPRLLIEKEEPDLPDGTILSQTPIAGSIIKPHQAVYCVVSKKPPPIKASALVSKNIQHVKKELSEKNIKAKTHYLASNKPKNYCIAQFPAVGQPIQEQTVIAYVSTGNTKLVICPRFIDKGLQDAVEFLENQNIAPEIIWATSQQIDISCTHIVDQRPLPGSLITLDDATQQPIKLYVK